MKDWLTRLQAALAAVADVTRRRGELEAAEALEREAAQTRAAAEQTREARRCELRRAQENHNRAAAGLSNLQQGLEELHRRAGAHQQVLRRRQDACSLLGVSELRPNELAVHLAGRQARLAEVDRERREGAQRLADASAYLEEYEKALDALRTLVDGEFPSDALHATSLEALRRYRELHALAGRVTDLGRELGIARQYTGRQAMVRGRAEKLGVVSGEGPASERVRALLEDVEAGQRRHESDDRTARASLSEVERTLAEMSTRRCELTEREPLWQELDAHARRLGAAMSLDVVVRLTLDRARALANERLVAAKAREEELTRTRERLLAEARGLLAAGGPFEPELLRLKDQLSAEMLAASFEDAGIEEAGLLEARLGPLVHALVVENPGDAA